ncbi:MAG: tyrosine-type recombinase/integrase, partial [Planctomycetota bacterium]
RRPKGKARWLVQKRVNGRLLRRPVGELSDLDSVNLETARRLAAKVLVQLAGGTDPAEERQAKRQAQKQAAAGGRVPVRDVLDAMLARMAEGGRSPKHVDERRRICEGLIASGCTDMCDPRARIKAEKYLRGLRARTGKPISELTRHRYAEHIRALGNLAIKRYEADELARDPFRNLEVGHNRLPAPAMFTLPELFQLCSDAALGTEVGRLAAFLLLSGCRLREGAWAEWDAIDLENASYHLRPLTESDRSEGRRLKRNKARIVHLMPELVALLRSWPSEHGRFIFPERFRVPTWHSTEAFRHHLAALGIPVDGRRWHTLRHAHCALAVACGVPEMQLRLSVGHGGSAMTAHYAAAAMAWRAKLRHWQGVFRLRDPSAAALLGGQFGAVAVSQ